jgi:inner membrane protein
MDSLTHIALGACIGEAFLGKKIGKKAMLWGALAQSIPDIDFVAHLWMNPAGALLAHRGFTHSILFAIIITPFLALVAEKWHRPHNISFRKWTFFFALQLFVHIFIDAFNNYGVGWFEPFSHYRISFNTIYVADPFFSIWPGIAFVVLLLTGRKNVHRKFWWRFGIIMSTLYMAYCIENKMNIDREVKEIAQDQSMKFSGILTTPTPLNNWLWYIILASDSGYHIGFRSVFDNIKKIDFHYFPRNDSLLKPFRNSETLQRLVRFSKGYYSAEKWSDTLVFNDLRFGQIIGWYDPKEKFVFHYFLQHAYDNNMVVQRGRFENWDWITFKSLIARIKGD